MISWKPYTDRGEPKFIQSDDTMTIVNAPDDRGRWLGTFLEPLKQGDQYTILAQARRSGPEGTASFILLTWWENVPGMVLDSVENVAEINGIEEDFKQFVYHFTVPGGVKLLRVDLRAWSGPGNTEFKDVRIVPRTDPPDPPDPPTPGPDEQLTVNLDFVDIIWRITASRETVTAHRIVREGYSDD